MAGRRANADIDFALIRVKDDGSLDTGFGPAGSNGFVTQDFFGNVDKPEAVAVDPQGRIVLGGTSRVGGDDDFSVARFDSTGKLDPTFGTAGKKTVDFTPVGADQDSASDMVIDPQGRIVLAGESSMGANAPDFALARLNGDGTRDASFGTDLGAGHNGEVVTPIGTSSDSALAVGIDADGRILAAGAAVVTGQSQFAVARYNPDGSLDTTFSEDGKVTTPIFSMIGGDLAFAVGADPHGRIVAAGRAANSVGWFDLAVVRYDPNGALDPTFGNGGKVTAPNGNGTSAASTLRSASSSRVHSSQPAAAAANSASGASPATPSRPPPRSTPAPPTARSSTTPRRRSSSPRARGAPPSAAGSTAPPGTAARRSPPRPCFRDGAHTFSVTATDRAGNTSPAATRSFTVDTRLGHRHYRQEEGQDAQEEGEGHGGDRHLRAGRLCLRGRRQAPAVLRREVHYPKLKKGKHTVTVTATDQAGNSAPRPRTSRSFASTSTEVPGPFGTLLGCR